MIRDVPESPPPVDATLADEVVDLVREAGELTLRWFRSSTLDVERKGDGTPVTAADKAAERFLREQIGRRWPDDAVVGEEEDDVAGTSGRTWTIDPIDGTKAFTHGVPLYSNLLALSDESGPAVGVVNLPALGQTVWAGRGRGAFEDGRPARVSDTDRLDGAYLSTSGLEHLPEGLVASVGEVGSYLRTWGDGYGYALVATGRIDAMIDHGVSVWDVAPMPLIMAEAGGRFTDLQGRDRTDTGSGLASNGAVHDQVLALLAPHVDPA
jgi:histidinol phosphatase-like enzyme (inositol monophosphatase family)